MTPRSEASFADILTLLGIKDSSRVRGDSATLPSFSGIEDISKAGPSDVVFVGSEKYLERARSSRAKLFIVDRSLENALLSSSDDKKTILFVDNAKVAMAKVSQFFGCEEWSPSQDRSSSSLIDPSAKIGKGVRLAPQVVIGPGAEIGDGVELHHGIVIGAGVKIGSGSKIYANVVIYDRVELGQRVIVHANTTLGSDGFGYAQEKTSVGVNHVKIIHTGSLIIGDDVEIGANSSVDRGTIGDTVIGRGAKIDNQVQIGHNCQIGEGAIICGSCALGGSSKVGRYAVLAGFCAVANGAEIGDGAIIGGMSGVQGQIGPGKVMVGNPLRERSEFYRIQASMTSLPEIFKFWKRTRKEKKE